MPATAGREGERTHTRRPPSPRRILPFGEPRRRCGGGDRRGPGQRRVGGAITEVVQDPGPLAGRPMSISMLIVNRADGRAAEVPVATTATFKAHWLPGADE